MTPHFTAAELRVEGEEDRIQENAKWLCVNLLEPIRAKFGPLSVTSGYRDPKRNELAGGKGTSFHLYTADHCAADFIPMDAPMTEVFRWIRMDSGLPFDKVILEHNPRTKAPACIHIQGFAKGEPRRLAYLGETGDAKSYQPVEVV